jgi:hypothetical protein
MSPLGSGGDSLGSVTMGMSAEENRRICERGLSDATIAEVQSPYLRWGIGVLWKSPLHSISLRVDLVDDTICLPYFPRLPSAERFVGKVIHNRINSDRFAKHGCLLSSLRCLVRIEVYGTSSFEPSGHCRRLPFLVPIAAGPSLPCFFPVDSRSFSMISFLPPSLWCRFRICVLVVAHALISEEDFFDLLVANLTLSVFFDCPFFADRDKRPFTIPVGKVVVLFTPPSLEGVIRIWRGVPRALGHARGIKA